MISKADILIVTATPVESRAVLDAFAGITGQPARPVPIGDRIYHDLGEVHDTRVFLALTEMGSGGLGASQQTVQKGIAALRPAAVILVGIAFGVDEQKQAIGDVLVSQQLLLYEPQRVGEGNIVPRGDKPHASSWLFNYLKSAQLYWNEPTITVRFGLVLSGEKLVDHLNYREQLQQLGPEAIGGEMEGAGLYAACQDAKVDWILVKAICDWADGHKAKDQDARQRLAARNAAAFVAHAIQRLVLRQPVNNQDSHEQQDPEQVQKPDVGSSPNQEKSNDDPSLQDKTAPKQENDMLKEREKLTKEYANKSRSKESGTPTSIIFDCLYQSFNHESIRVFCQCYFEHLYKELREFDQFKTVIRHLIAYCEEQSKIDNLWLHIEKENINQYKIYYPQWKKSILENQKSQRTLNK